MLRIKEPYQYVIDSSALFDLNKQYPKTIFPSVWDNFNEMCEQKLIVAPREVLREIKGGEDELLEWAEEYEYIFLEPCEQEFEINQSILKQYPPEILLKYSVRPWADPLVISCAKFYGLPIIQHETGGQYKIPFIAKQLDLACLRLVQFFDEARWKF